MKLAFYGKLLQQFYDYDKLNTVYVRPYAAQYGMRRNL